MVQLKSNSDGSSTILGILTAQLHATRMHMKDYPN